MNQYPIISFIGAGNMSRAIIGGLLKNGYPADHIWATAPDTDMLTDLKTQGLNTTADNHEAVAASEIVILGVKPQVMKQVCTELSQTLANSAPLLVSLAAGVTIASMERWIGTQIPTVRCMPNTPALVQTGASGLFANNLVSQVQREQTEQILGAVGITVWVTQESEIDAVTAISGSGPAYYFLMMEAMIDAGETLGLSRETAKALALQTAAGAARMVQETGEEPAELRRRVTSPKGTTEQAILSFQADGLETVVLRALTACRNRAIELAQEMDKS
ncbi:pyrroline-5-carboxylate reductase [Nitrincola sp. MINF-07-Sa-05]|uniref:pyrroline-5-carboxylate reductase n=1 Tax=Nitrincola salilacus TaxID=3400273 RepID=UPI003918162B